MRFPIWWYPIGIWALGIAIVSAPQPVAGQSRPQSALALIGNGSAAAAPEGAGSLPQPQSSLGTGCLCAGEPGGDASPGEMAASAMEEGVARIQAALSS